MAALIRVSLVYIRSVESIQNCASSSIGIIEAKTASEHLCGIARIRWNVYEVAHTNSK